jgi:hypothetical protein
VNKPALGLASRAREAAHEEREGGRLQEVLEREALAQELEPKRVGGVSGPHCSWGAVVGSLGGSSHKELLSILAPDGRFRPRVIGFRVTLGNVSPHAWWAAVGSFSSYSKARTEDTRNVVWLLE